MFQHIGLRNANRVKLLFCQQSRFHHSTNILRFSCHRVPRSSLLFSQALVGPSQLPVVTHRLFAVWNYHDKYHEESVASGSSAEELESPDDSRLVEGDGISVQEDATADADDLHLQLSKLGPIGNWTVDTFPQANEAQRMELVRLIDDFKQIKLLMTDMDRVLTDLRISKPSCNTPDSSSNLGEPTETSLKTDLRSALSAVGLVTKLTQYLRESLVILALKIIGPSRNFQTFVDLVENIAGWHLECRPYLWEIFHLTKANLAWSHFFALAKRGNNCLARAAAEECLEAFRRESKFGPDNSLHDRRRLVMRIADGISDEHLASFARSKGLHLVILPMSNPSSLDELLSNIMKAIFAIVYVEKGMSKLREVLKSTGLIPGISMSNSNHRSSTEGIENGKEYLGAESDTSTEELEETLESPNSIGRDPSLPDVWRQYRVQRDENLMENWASLGPAKPTIDSRLQDPPAVARTFILELRQAAEEEKQPTRCADCSMEQLWEDHKQVWRARAEIAKKIEDQTHILDDNERVRQSIAERFLDHYNQTIARLGGKKLSSQYFWTQQQERRNRLMWEQAQEWPDKRIQDLEDFVAFLGKILHNIKAASNEHLALDESKNASLDQERLLFDVADSMSRQIFAIKERSDVSHSKKAKRIAALRKFLVFLQQVAKMHNPKAVIINKNIALALKRRRTSSSGNSSQLRDEAVDEFDQEELLCDVCNAITKDIEMIRERRVLHEIKREVVEELRGLWKPTAWETRMRERVKPTAWEGRFERVKPIAREGRLRKRVKWSPFRRGVPWRIIGRVGGV